MQTTANEIQLVAADLQNKLPLQGQHSYESLLADLANSINQMIGNDFAALVQLLYSVDVPEPQIRNLLQIQPDADAANLIATVVIKRQLEKVRLRKSFAPPQHIAEDEKW